MTNPSFQNLLLQWYQQHKRDLPWRETRDPYRIWLSEVILQQTRVDQGLPYYHKFVAHYPIIEDLAEAPEDKVLKDWEGLGYYSRARNLHQAAKQIVADRAGEFPTNYQDLRQLKGVGDYTASAISSIVFNEARAVVDGNVYRVLSRFFGIKTPVNTTAGVKQFKELAQELLHQPDPGTYNQALMEFGALQCVPKNPKCEACPLQASCAAFAQNTVATLPVKLRKHYDRQRYLHYALIRHKGRVLLFRRSETDIWRNLYEFFLIEFESALGIDGQTQLLSETLNKDFTIASHHQLKPHKLSHQTLHIQLLELELQETPSADWVKGGLWVAEKELISYAFPRPLRGFLDRNQLTLPLQ